LHLAGWEIPLAFFILVASFGVIYYFSMRKLKNTNMLNVFKD
jgi:hypothetical protein